MRILVKRNNSYGDVLCVTPVTHRLRRENPDAIIHVKTVYPYVFWQNTDVDDAGPNFDDADYDRVIELNLSFEKRFRKVHGTDSYMLDAFGDTGKPEENGVYLAKTPVPDLGFPLRDAIVVYPARTWAIRTMPLWFWTNLVKLLRADGRRVIVVGTSQDYDLPDIDADTRDKLGPQQQAALIQQCAVIVGSESGIMGGILPATETPAVHLITMSTPDICAPYRNGHPFAARYTPVLPKVDCWGCSLRQPQNCTAHGCERGDTVCVQTFVPKEVAALTLEAAEIDRSMDKAA